jgi:hypothetical protein
MERRVMSNFTAGSMLGSKHDRHGPEAGSSEPTPPQQAPEPAQESEESAPEESSSDEEEEEEDSEPVPVGTTQEIIAWVGNSKGRAQRALDREKAHAKPRKSVTNPLEKFVSA